MPSVNDALRANIARVKRASSDAPLKFTCILGREGALLINPNAKLVVDAKKEVGSSTAVSGVCFQNAGALVFETSGEPPASLAKAIKACIQKYAGLTAAIETRREGSGEDEAAEQEEEQTELKAKITKKVKTLQTKLADLVKTAPEKADPIRTRIIRAGVAFKSNRLEEAESLLQEAEELL